MKKYLGFHYVWPFLFGTAALQFFGDGPIITGLFLLACAGLLTKWGYTKYSGHLPEFILKRKWILPISALVIGSSVFPQRKYVHRSAPQSAQQSAPQEEPAVMAVAPKTIEQMRADSAERAKGNVPIAQDTFLNGTIEEIEAKIKQVKSKFIYTKDEFNNIGFYRHKTWGKNQPNRKTVTCTVNSSGYAYLTSVYVGHDWLFHTKVSFLIDDQVFDTEDVPTYSKDNIHDNDSDRVYEYVHYLNAEDLIQKISENTGKIIKVRFHGNQYYDDITLSSRDKSAIKDCAELAAILKTR